MEKEIEAPEAPVVIHEATADEPLIDNRRAEIEKLVIAENETIPQLESEPAELPVKETPKEEAKVEESDPLEKIKKSVQKRIDKVVAQKKSVEEELAETKAELERLKASPKTEKTLPEDTTPPTPEQVEAYIAQMQEEGKHKEAAAAIRYLVKLEKEEALKSVREEQNKAQKESDSQKEKQLSDWTDLQKDYLVYTEDGKIDSRSELNLSNQKGLLYTTALALYNDKELHSKFYDDQNVIQGFRRAVSDAYREIHQQGLIAPKGEKVIPRNPRAALAEPDTEVAEETPPTFSNSLSDAEKVREEIRARNKNRFKR